MFRRYRRPTHPAPEPWGRRRVQLLLAVSVMAGLVVAGFGVWSVVTGTQGPPSAGARPGSGHVERELSEEDAVADSPMQPADLQQALAGPLEAASHASIALPAATRAGEVGVPTGFPKTPEGALAQLVEVDRRAIESVSVVTAQKVVTAWAEPGGPTARTWSGVGAVAQLLSSAGLPADGADDLVVELRPAMGRIKGRVGDGYVIPCVDFVLTVSVTGEAPQRVAVADCQRMRWVGERWVIGAGAEPAPAPSIWPGTAASYAAGYRWLEGDG
ncbi:hypothetical protein EDD33_1985 [Nocardioides aurantiacus]|uniref:Uncharacterized protein n=2 Tax=Nocardioides aurantiacus TaxID=86796 RepID=A0A3N2CV68_9ACTN|nr:hypothetical protein EDD33_1985 [Nocardioides aurantiacus]